MRRYYSCPSTPHVLSTRCLSSALVICVRVPPCAPLCMRVSMNACLLHSRTAVPQRRTLTTVAHDSCTRQLHTAVAHQRQYQPMTHAKIETTAGRGKRAGVPQLRGDAARARLHAATEEFGELHLHAHAATRRQVRRHHQVHVTRAHALRIAQVLAARRTRQTDLRCKQGTGWAAGRCVRVVRVDACGTRRERMVSCRAAARSLLTACVQRGHSVRGCAWHACTRAGCAMRARTCACTH